MEFFPHSPFRIQFLDTWRSLRPRLRVESWIKADGLLCRAHSKSIKCKKPTVERSRTAEKSTVYTCPSR